MVGWRVLIEKLAVWESNSMLIEDPTSWQINGKFIVKSWGTDVPRSSKTIYVPDTANKASPQFKHLEPNT